MLSVAKLTLGQEAYYEQQIARGLDDYYAGRGESPGIWVGSGSAGPGLVGVVGDEDLGTLLRGVNPGDGERLRSPVREQTITKRRLDVETGERASASCTRSPTTCRPRRSPTRRRQREGRCAGWRRLVRSARRLTQAEARDLEPGERTRRPVGSRLRSPRRCDVEDETEEHVAQPLGDEAPVGCLSRRDPHVVASRRDAEVSSSSSTRSRSSADERRRPGGLGEKPRSDDNPTGRE
jgi:hypothetical protein